MHKMSGTWNYARSERQAIREENEFRAQLAAIRQEPYYERVGKRGMAICPDSETSLEAIWGQALICDYE